MRCDTTLGYTFLRNFMEFRVGGCILIGIICNGGSEKVYVTPFCWQQRYVFLFYLIDTKLRTETSTHLALVSIRYTLWLLKTNRGDVTVRFQWNSSVSLRLLPSPSLVAVWLSLEMTEIWRSAGLTFLIGWSGGWFPSSFHRTLTVSLHSLIAGKLPSVGAVYGDFEVVYVSLECFVLLLQIVAHSWVK